jgi:hypothetical protein
MVLSEMNSVYGPENIRSVHVVHNEAELAPLVAQYDKVKAELEDLVDQYMSLFKRGKKEEPKQVGGLGAGRGARRTAWGLGPVPCQACCFFQG